MNDLTLVSVADLLALAEGRGHPTLLPPQQAKAVRHVHFHNINVQDGDIAWVTVPAVAADFLRAVVHVEPATCAHVHLIDGVLSVWF